MYIHTTELKIITRRQFLSLPLIGEIFYLQIVCLQRLLPHWKVGLGANYQLYNTNSMMHDVLHNKNITKLIMTFLLLILSCTYFSKCSKCELLFGINAQFRDKPSVVLCKIQLLVLSIPLDNFMQKSMCVSTQLSTNWSQQM